MPRARRIGKERVYYVGDRVSTANEILRTRIEKKGEACKRFTRTKEQR